MVDVKHVCFGYEKKQAILKDISFSLQKGEVVGLLGANGCGKTTLMKLLAGLLHPNQEGSAQAKQEAEILFQGMPIAQAQGEIAFISEVLTFPLFLTAGEYGQFLADFYDTFDMGYYQKLLQLFDLRADAVLRKFSKGQKAKVEIASGLAKRTKLILMDEPFAGKDLFTRLDFMQSFAASLTGEETVLITTHDIHEVEQFLDRVIVLQAQADGSCVALDITMDALRAQQMTLEEAMKDVFGYQEGRFWEIALS